MRLLPGSPDDREREFTDYYTARGPMVRKTAYLLCGDWHLAEDLTQITFTKLYLAWRRISQPERIDAYVRKLLMHAFLDEKRRPWRRERSTEVLGEGSAAAAPNIDDRLLLVRALTRLPPGQRAVLVLRFWADLSVAEAARTLGCSQGTVKSQTARGLENVRGQLSGSRPIDGFTQTLKNGSSK